MKQSEMKRLMKLEDRIYEIAKDNGLKFCDIEFDVIPENKMFEIMSYGLPGQISNWKFGRDYEKTRTIYEKMGDGLPYEVVVNTVPSRAYLMKNNSIALQALIVAHVVGHVAFFGMNQYHIEADSSIASRLATASQRFDDYEKKYGIDLVEQTVDAGHSIMFHSNPWIKDETEDEKRDRIFERMKQKQHDKTDTAFGDFFEDDSKADIDREKWNNALYMRLKNKTPVEPTEDLLRYIIDNSRNLASWQKDILEIIRQVGRYYWPIIKTKYMNEGFATYWHERILRQLFQENLLNAEEHAECNYSNSLVKAKSPFSMNPYLIGSTIWEDIVRRWDTGQHGNDYHDIENHDLKKSFDNNAKEGHKKMFEVLRTSNDWMFMSNYLTNDLVRELEMYMYVQKDSPFFTDVVIADKDIDEIRQIIVKSFSHSGIPKIYVENGNHNNSGKLLLKHEHVGIDLFPEYTRKTLEHIGFLWGSGVMLETKYDKKEYQYVYDHSVEEERTNCGI